MKVGRNDPCPCGSGKKYKKCCLENDKIIQFPQNNNISSINAGVDEKMKQMMLQSTGFSSTEEMDLEMNEYQNYCELAHEHGKPIPSFMEYLGKGNPASDMLGDIQKQFSGKEFSSIEEANTAFKKLSGSQNSQPVNDFLGLSSEQMHSIIENEIEDNDDLVVISSDVEEEDVIDTDIIKRSLFVLQMMSDNSGSLPVTAKGNLQVKYCNAYLNFIVKENNGFYKVKSEEEVPDLTWLLILLLDTDHIERLKTKIRLTVKGKNFLNKKDLADSYLGLFDYYVEENDWLDMTPYYDQNPIIQDSVLFSFFILHKKVKKYTPQDKIYSYFHKAFPMIDGFYEKEEGVDIMSMIYDFIFLDLFCKNFGLIDFRVLENDDGLNKREYKTSALFKKLIKWSI